MAITLRNVKGSPLTHVEMDENFSALTGSLTAGSGLTGGGLKTDDVTFDVGQGDGIFVGANSVAVNNTVARTGSNTFTGNQIITGSAYISGNLNVDGGVIGSTSSTFCLIDSGVTTVEFAGSATSIDIGASTGTTNINNNLVVDGTGTIAGDIAVNGGDITSTSSTFNFVTSSVSSLNIGLSATAVEIGSGGGTTNINNNLVVDGNAVIAGKVTAQEFHTEFVSASIIYQSGSTKFGDTSDDIHQMTGTLDITGSVRVSGNALINQDLTINGGDIRTSAGTFNFVTSSVSNLNVGLSATTVDIGASTGTTSINNNLDVDGDVNIDGGDLTTNQTTFNLINSNATTVNFAGNASNISVGSGTGNTTVNNDLVVEGGDIKSTSGTFNFVTGSVTNLNIGLAATSLDIGASSGTTSINNNLDVDGDVNIDGGDLTTNQSTFNLVNTNATTVNIAGDGTAVSIGKNTGTVTVPGNLTVNNNTNLGNSSVSDIHVIQGITSVTGSFAVDDIKLDGQQISTFNGNLEISPAKVVDLKSNLTASANFAVIEHTGAGFLQVTSNSGQVKVENTIFNGDDVVITGSVAVNAGNITTTSGTGNIFNTNATTLNIGGAGTDIEIGSSTGTTRVNNSLIVEENTTLGADNANYVDIKGQKISLSGSNTTIEHKAASGNLRIQTVGGSNNKLVLSSSGDINIEQSMTMVNIDTSYQSQGYQSGFAGQGFDINFSDKSSAEFDDLTIRGSLRVFELLINQIRATNGSLFISSTGKIDQVISNGTDGAGSSSFILVFDTGSGDVGHGFTDDDIIRAQRVNRAAMQNVGQTQSLDDNLVFRSDLVVTGVQDLRIITASLISGTSAPSSSFEYVRLGNSTNANRQGTVYLTADDNYAPFIDVVDGITSHNDWNNSATDGGVKVRVGKIDGINSPVFGDLTGYGMWASGSVYLEGSVNATSGLIGGWAIYPGYLESNNIRLQSSGSSGGELIAIGQGASMTGNGVFLSGSGDFNIQSHATQFIRKQGDDLRVRTCNFSLESGDLLLSGSASCGYIGVGTLTNPTTVSNSCQGFFADNGGNVLIKGSTADNNYIKVAGTGCIEIKSTDFDLVSGQLSLVGNAGSSFLKLGTLADATTTGTTNSGFYADNNGNVLIKGNSNGKNYIKVAGAGTVDINSDSFDLLAGSTLRLTNSGGGLFTLGDTVYVDADIAISGSGQAKFGNINFDGRNGGSEFTGTTALGTTGSPGFFLSGSGEFNFVQNSNNYIRKVGSTFALAAENAILCGNNVTVSTCNFNLTGTNLAFNNTRLYLGTITTSGDSAGAGFYADNSGNFRVFGNSTNYITVGGSSINIASDSFCLNAGAGDLLIDSSGRSISIANGRIVLDGCSISGAGYIKVGTLTDASTTATTNCGFFADGNGNLLIKGDDSDNNYIKFDANAGNSALQIKTNNFSVVGGNVNMTGQVSACCGEIADFTIGGSQLYTGTKSTFASTAAGVYVGCDGIALGTNSPFKVTSTGALTATSAVIKGNICADAGYFNGSVCASSGYFNGAVCATSGFFNGIVCASGGTFTGQISAGCGTIGGWTIGASSLTGGSVVLDCSGIIRSATNFSSGDGFYLSSAPTNNFRVGDASGARLQFDGTNLEVYNSSNQVIFSGGATSNIAGWNITTTSLSKCNVTLDSGGSISVGSGNTIFKADSCGIYLGNAAFASAPFRVCQNGSLIANSANITGNINANSGYFNGAVCATSGFFNGAVCANSGYFNGAVCATSGFFNGAVCATSGFFNGAVCATSGFFSGNICAAGGSFCGLINASCLNAGTVSVNRLDVDAIFAEDINFTGQITGDDGTNTLEIDPGSIFIADGTGLVGDIANGTSYNYMRLTQDLQFRYVTTDLDTLGYNICFVPVTGIGTGDGRRPGQLRFISTKNAGTFTDLALGVNTTYDSPGGSVLANRVAVLNLPTKISCDLNVVNDLYVGDDVYVANCLEIGCNLIVDTDTFFVDSVSRHVGVGTATPCNGLHIKDTVSNHVPILLENNDIVGMMELESQSALPTGAGILNIGINTGRGFGGCYAGSNSYDGAWFRFDTRTASTYRRFNIFWRSPFQCERELFTVTYLGCVGIACCSPTYTLTMTGDQRIGNGSLGVNVNPNTTDGRVDASNDIVAYSSDCRLKSNIQSLQCPLEKIHSIQGFTYNWNEKAEELAGYNTEESLVGVFAQEVQAILPEAVKLAPFDNDGTDTSISGDNYLTVQYERLVPLLIEGIKEQQCHICQLTDTVEKLRSCLFI